jgi:hypothetical protein
MTENNTMQAMTELEMIRSILSRPEHDSDVSSEFRLAATRWEQELSSGKYTSLTSKQRGWLLYVFDRCESHDVGVATCGFGGLYGDGEDEAESFFDPDIGDR